jgi:subtilisin family serine protease
MQEAVGADRFDWDSQDEADHNYFFRPGRVLVAAANDAAFNEAFANRSDDFDGGVPEPVSPDNAVDGINVYDLPTFRDNRSRDVVDALGILDDELGPGVVSPEHYLHIASIGNGRSCPATEPTETGRRKAWPPALTDENIGKDVQVVVLDMGYVDHSDLAQGVVATLEHYEGHGVFIERIIQGRAPGAIIERYPYPMPGGVISELDLAAALRQALVDYPDCKIVNLCAGAHTYHDLPLLAFEQVWTDKLSHMPDTVLVCAAGNDGSYAPFYPAASPWAYGVGSLDRDETVSSFSNFMASADVYVLGRNHVNEFPRGRYTCREAPDRGDRRRFRNGWARWSGTSFAAPVFTGLVAATMTQQGMTAPEAAKELVYGRSRRSWDEIHGRHRLLGLQHYT